MAESKFWGIHAGRLGEADSLFREKGVIALGWSQFGDLSQCKTRDEFKKRYAEVFKGAKPGVVQTNASQLFRFVHEPREGDFVVYPSKATRQIWIGRIAGPYFHERAGESHYPNRRKVEWLKEVPRTHFSQGALFEVGSAMSFFQVKSYAEEFQNALAGKTPSAPVASDPSVAAVAEDIEQTAEDFILKTLSQEQKGLPLEDFVLHLLTRMGYRARKTQANTPSVDLIAHKDELGFEPPVIKVQVKSGDDKVTDKDVSALYGKLGQGEFGLVIALGEFTSEAHRFADSKSNLRLIDGTGLVDLVLRHYEQFDPRYKGLLPLRRVYVPEPVEEAEE